MPTLVICVRCCQAKCDNHSYIVPDVSSGLVFFKLKTGVSQLC